MKLNLISLLIHIGNAVILFFALRHFLYKPVRKFMDRRAQMVDGMIEGAQDRQRQADEVYALAQSAADSARAQEAQAAQHGALAGQERAELLVQQAHEEAGQILQQAREEAEQLLKNAREQARAEAGELALDIAAKVLEREINAQDHERMIHQFLSEVG